MAELTTHTNELVKEVNNSLNELKDIFSKLSKDLKKELKSQLEDFVNGEEVYVRDYDSENWTRAIFIGEDPSSNKLHVVLLHDDYASFKQCRKPKKYTLEEVAQKAGVDINEIELKTEKNINHPSARF